MIHSRMVLLKEFGLSQRLRVPWARVIPESDLRLRTREQRYKDALAIIPPPRVFRVEDPNGDIFVASFAHNPTGNHYDYVYIPLIDDLIKNGILADKDEMVEITSGNSGLAAAWATNQLGPYPLTIYTAGSLPEERIKPLKELGANVVTTEGYMSEIARKMRADFKELRNSGDWDSEVFRKDGERYPEYLVPYFVNKASGRKKIFLNHSEQMSTVRRFGLAFEGIIDILPDDININAIFSVLGNFTTTQAMKRYLVGRNQFSDARLIGLESQDNPVMYNRIHGIQRAEAVIDKAILGMILPGMDWLTFQDESILDDIRLVVPEEASSYMNAWNDSVSYSEETIGSTSAAGMIAGKEYLRTNPGSHVLVWHYDTGEKYKSYNAPENRRLAHLSDFGASVYHPINRLRPTYRQPKYSSLHTMPTCLSGTII